MLYDDAVSKTVNETCCKMLGLPIFQLGETYQPSRDCITSQITIHGDYPSELTLTCSRSFASVLAGVMFFKRPSQLDDQLVQDSVGEFANILAGNLRVLLPGKGELSMPTRKNHQDSQADLTITDTSFQCDGRPFRIRLDLANQYCQTAKR